ncbi:MAG: SusC/RagA family TonB-linked outer membrane protein, partial [Pedobacter sp.]
MKEKLLLLVVMTIFCANAIAQTRTITGKVTGSDDGIPIPGASVQVKGTNAGTQTNVNGDYSISVSAEATTLLVKFIGYTDQEVPITVANQINISLVPSTTALTEVVVVAYGTVKKENFTGSAAVIKEDVFANRPVTSFEKALQGAAAGVEVSSVSGQPGATSTVRIRGVGSFSASSSPLYVVDGIAITDGDLSQVAQTSDVLSSLNPNDIASVTVLKDATAAAIYGSRAGNGVVLITTKQGQEGKTQFSVTGSGGYSSQAVKKFAVLNASQYYKVFWDQFYNEEIADGTSPDAAALSANERTNDELRANPYSAENPYLANGVLANGARLLYDTDWRDAVQQRGVTKDVNVSASGGNDKIKYFVSGGYFDQKGIIIASDFKRYSAKFNVSNEVTDFLSVGINNILARSDQNTPAGSTGASNPVQFGDATANIYPLYELDENGNPVLDAKGNPVYNYINPVTPDFNPVGLSKLDEYNTKTSRVITNPYATLKFLDGFTAKTSIGIDYINNRERQFYNPEHGDGASVNGRGYRFSAEDLTVTFVNTLTYANTFGKHSINA